MSLSVDIRRHLAGFDLDVSFEVADARETLALLGPSGCGKSMTLKCVAGIVTPDEGRIVLNGRVLFDSAAGVNLRPQERRVGYLFQNYALFPNMTVEQNVGVGVLGTSKEERAARVAERVALARIMASQPELLLLDEPFSALDGYLRWQLELELTDTLREFPGGSVYVSHNRDEVFRMCDTVCVVSAGKSEPKLTVSELFSTPSTLAAALISGCKNVSRARKLTKGQSLCQLLDCEDWGVTLATSLPVPEGLSHVGVRAHYFRVVGKGKKPAGTEAAQNLIPCEVDRVIDNTFSTIAMLRTPGGGLLRYECEKDAWAALGEPDHLTVAIDPADVMPLSDGKAAGTC